MGVAPGRRWPQRSPVVFKVRTLMYCAVRCGAVRCALQHEPETRPCVRRRLSGFNVCALRRCVDCGPGPRGAFVSFFPSRSETQMIVFSSHLPLSCCFSLVKSGRSSSSSSGSVPFDLTTGSIPTAMLMVKYARCNLGSFLCLAAPAPVLSH